MKTTPTQKGQSLGDCLRAAQADAERFHGGQAPQAWQGAGLGKRGSVLAVSFALLAIAAATLLAAASADDIVPPPTVVAARGDTDNWIGRAPTEMTPDADTQAAKPAAPAATNRTMPVVVDGGDIDVASTVPASVLSAHRASQQSDGPRVAPMNVPTFPSEHDNRPGEPEPSAERPPAL